MPVIVTGVRVATLLTCGIAAIATLVAGGGLGDLIKSGFSRLGLPNSMEAIWAGTVMTVVIALVLDLALALLLKLLSPRVFASVGETIAGLKPPRKKADEEWIHSV